MILYIIMGKIALKFQIRKTRFFSISVLVFYNCSRFLNPISVRFSHLDFEKIIIICR